MSNEKIITRLNEILRTELAGAMMYLHYSYYIYGHARIPIVGWLREQSSEGMTHATEVGDQIIYLGGDPETHPTHDAFKLKFDSLDDMLRQTLKLEKAAFEMYATLLKDIEDSNLMLRVFLENKIMEESGHIQEIELMLRPDVVK
jgi:bacterioferritin